MPKTPQVGRRKLPTNAGNLIHPTFVDHVGDTRLDAPIELGQRHVEPNDGRRPSWRIGHARHTRRTAGDRVDLERTDHPPRIPSGPLGANRIDAPELGIQRLWSFQVESLFEHGSQLGVRRCIGEVPAVEERSQVEAATTLQYGQSTLAVDVRDGIHGQRLIVGDGERSAGIDDVEQPAANTRELFGGRLIRADVAVPVDLPRINGDQFPVETTRCGNGERRLPAGGGTDDRDDALDA